MPSVLETLIVELRGDNAELRRNLRDAVTASTSAANTIERRFATLGAGFTRVGRNLTLGVTTPLLALGAAAVNSAAQVEVLETAFTTLLGSGERAKGFLEELQQFAAGTPFRFPELAAAGRNLVAFGVAADDTIPTLRRIGDVSAGIGASVGEIAEIYGKARVQGRLFAEDINQLTGRGIPIIAELAKQFGVTEEEVRGLVSSGEVGFGNLEQAFVDLTSEGGKFFGLTQAQSETTAGKISTLRDNVGLLGAEFGEVLLPTINKLVSGLTSAVQAFNGLSDSTKTIVVQVGLVVAALGPLSVGVGGVIRAGTTLVGVFQALGGAGGLAAAGVRAASAAITAFPVVAVLTAAAAVGTLAGRFIQATNALNEYANAGAQNVQGLNDEQIRNAEAINTLLAARPGLVERWTSEVERGVITQDELTRRLDAYDARIDAVRDNFRSASAAASEVVVPPVTLPDVVLPDIDVGTPLLSALGDAQGVADDNPIIIKARVDLVDPLAGTLQDVGTRLNREGREFIDRVTPDGGAGRGVFGGLFGGVPTTPQVIARLPRGTFPTQVPAPRVPAGTAPDAAGVRIIGLDPLAVRQLRDATTPPPGSIIPFTSTEAPTGTAVDELLNRLASGDVQFRPAPQEPAQAPPDRGIQRGESFLARAVRGTGAILPFVDANTDALQTLNVSILGLNTGIKSITGATTPPPGSVIPFRNDLLPKPVGTVDPSKFGPGVNPLAGGPGAGSTVGGFGLRPLFDPIDESIAAADAFKIEMAQVGAGVALGIVNAIQSGSVEDAFASVFQGAGSLLSGGLGGLLDPLTGGLLGIGLGLIGSLIPAIFGGRDEEETQKEEARRQVTGPAQLRLDFTTNQYWTFQGANPDEARRVNGATLNQSIQELQRVLTNFLPRIERLEAATGVTTPRGVV